MAISSTCAVRNDVKKVKRSSNIWLKTIGLVVFLLVLIGTSVGVTLIAIGAFDAEVAERKAKGKFVADIFEAEKICQARIRLDHGDILHSIALNERSGRYDKSGGQYKLFYQLSLYRDKTKRTGVAIFYSNCYIASANGSVARMEYVEDGDGSSEVSKRDDTNFIGL